MYTISYFFLIKLFSYQQYMEIKFIEIKFPNSLITYFEVIPWYITNFADSSIDKECFISNGLYSEIQPIENVLLLMCRRRRGWRKFRRFGAAQVPTQSHDFQSGTTRGARKGVREIALPLRVHAWASRLENVTFGSARSGEALLFADIKDKRNRRDDTQGR